MKFKILVHPYMATPKHKNPVNNICNTRKCKSCLIPNIGGHKLYKFVIPFYGHHYYKLVFKFDHVSTEHKIFTTRFKFKSEEHHLWEIAP